MEPLRKTRWRLITLASAALCLTLGATAGAGEWSPEDYNYDCGSDGSYGPIEVAEGAEVTIPLPEDGVIHATTVTVDHGGTLKFERNVRNTPVYILASGPVQIDGWIDLRGQPGTDGGGSEIGRGGAGGPCGWRGGDSEWLGLDHGRGHGPDSNDGASKYASSLLIPPIGGSGGDASDQTGRGGGGGGGGAIAIASNHSITFASGFGSDAGIDVRGGNGSFDAKNGGPGSVRLVAPIVQGEGTIEANAVSTAYSRGRVRIDAIDNTAFHTQVNGPTPYYGSILKVFPDVVPQLEVLGVGQQTIADGTYEPQSFLFPMGAELTQKIGVQAKGFPDDVDVTIVLIPDHGERTTYSMTIYQESGDPPWAEIDVTFPPNVRTRVFVHNYDL